MGQGMAGGGCRFYTPQQGLWPVVIYGGTIFPKPVQRRDKNSGRVQWTHRVCWSSLPVSMIGLSAASWVRHVLRRPFAHSLGFAEGIRSAASILSSSGVRTSQETGNHALHRV